VSGVRVGSRLEQLLALESRLKHEIEVERARERDLASGLHAEPLVFRRPVVDRTDTDDVVRRVPGGTPAEVRAWAVHHGLMPAGQSGRIKTDIFAAYADANQDGAA
jgi:hypothetical protein